MNGSSAEDPLEEIVVRNNSTPRRRRKSSEEAKTPSKNYPKGKGQQGQESDFQDSRPLLLQHARSEPTSRLQYFALGHRLFQPHSRDSRGRNSQFDEENGVGTGDGPEPGADEGVWLPSSEGQEGLPWGQDGTRRPSQIQLPRLHTLSPARTSSAGRSGHGFKPPTPGGNDSSSSKSKYTSLPSEADVADPAPPSFSRSLRHSKSAGVGSEQFAIGTASNGLTAVQMLENEEKMRTLIRGESLSSGRGNSLRSILKRGQESASMLRVPTMVDLADMEIGSNERELPVVSSALPRFAVKDDSLPMPKANAPLQGLTSFPRRVSWLDPSLADKTPVVEHAVAGDLHLGGPLLAQPAVKVTSGVSGNSVPTSGTHKDKEKDAGRHKGNLTPASSDMQFEEEEKDEKQLAEEEQHKLHWHDFWKHYRFWSNYAPALFTLTMFALGTSMYIWKPDAIIAYFQVWSWCFFLGSFPALYWISRLVVHLLVIAVESTLFTTKQVLYYTYGVRKPLARLIRVSLVLPIFVACFSGKASHSPAVKKAYNIMVRLLGCAILFFFGNVLRAALAKMMATHFHKEAHFTKMKQALAKEYYLMALSQPRTEVVPPAEPRTAEAGAEGGSVRRTSGVYDRLVKGLPRPLRKGASLPDLVQAEHDARSQHHSEGAASAVPSTAVESPELPRRPSWQQPMRTFLGRASPTSGPSLATASKPSLASKASRPADNQSEASSHRSLGQRATRGVRLLRTAAFKKDIPPAESVTDLTTALEGVKDTRTKSFNGELIQKLHVAEKHIRKNKLKVTFADQLGSAAHSNGTTQEQEVASKQEAKRLAFYLFWNVKPYFDRNHILLEDIKQFLPPNKAAHAFEILDSDCDGKISLHDIRDSILQIYKERKDLALTLKDTKTIAGKLRVIIGVIIHVLLVLAYLIIFEVDVNKVWITFSSMVVAFSFIFATAISNLFMAVIFLFVVHPYDVGDGILIGGEMHYVEEISLQNCVFKRWDGARVWYPNTVMLAAPIINMTRSGCKWENFTLYVDIGTPSEVFNILNRRIEEHMEANSHDLTGEFACFNFGCGDPMKIKLGVYFEFSHSGTDLGRLNVGRHNLATCITDTLYSLGVKYSMPSFSGPTPPGFADAARTEMGRPLTGSQVPTPVVHHAATHATAAEAAHQQAVGRQFPGPVASPNDPVHPGFMQRFT